MNRKGAKSCLIMTIPELLSLSLSLTPLGGSPPERPLPSWWGRGAHALLLRAIQSVDPDLAAAIHEPGETRPFTVSSLLGRFPDHAFDPADASHPSATYRLRFTALSAPVAQALLQVTETGGPLSPGKQIELDDLAFRVLPAPPDPAGQGETATTTYAEFASASLLGEQPAPRTIRLRFISPTNFTSGGRLSSNGHNVPFPLPDFVFGSLLDRWNAFSPVAFPAELRRYAAECLHISRFDISSRAAQVAGGIQLGMTGIVTFKAHNYDRYWFSLVHTLARYAFFAGVGAKTSMGLGQCKVVEED